MRFSRRRRLFCAGARPEAAQVVAFIDDHRDRFGVEPICRALEVAHSTYYAAKSRAPSRRKVRDEELKAVITEVWDENFKVYGVRKMWKALRRRGETVGRDQVARLMRDLGLSGVIRGKAKRTTTSDEAGERPADLVDRDFNPPAPNRLWVADLTYVRTWAGFVYVFIIDAFSRRIVGWQIANHLRTDLALDALEMAIWQRPGRLDGLVHHSDRGVQYLAIRYTEPLADAGAVTSYGTSADVEAVLKVAPSDAKSIIGGEVVFIWYSVYESNTPNVIGTETVTVSRRPKTLESGPYTLATGYTFHVIAVGSTSGGAQAFSVTSPDFTVGAVCA